jgi:hypothetical protein
MAEETLKRAMTPSGVYWATAPRLVAQHRGSGRLLARALNRIERAKELPLSGDSKATPDTYGVSRTYYIHRLGHFNLWLWYAAPYGGGVVLYALRDVPPPGGGPR